MPGPVRIDLHVHSNASHDSRTAPAAVALASRRLGLDPIFLTDHDTVAGALQLKATGVPVVVGEEITTADGELIGIFLEREVASRLPAHDTAGRIKEQGGLVYLQHPYDQFRRHLTETAIEEIADQIDIVEVFNARSDEEANRRAADLCLTLGAAAGAGSDAHRFSEIGSMYVELPTFEGAQAFLASLRQARIVTRPSRLLLRAKHWLHR